MRKTGAYTLNRTLTFIMCYMCEDLFLPSIFGESLEGDLGDIWRNGRIGAES